jgi:hypothetical protein
MKIKKNRFLADCTAKCRDCDWDHIDNADACQKKAAQHAIEYHHWVDLDIYYVQYYNGKILDKEII